jgi:hypothetical protein
MLFLCITLLPAAGPRAQTSPRVINIDPQLPATQTTIVPSVTYRVTFQEKVSGVGAFDFYPTALSGNVRGFLADLALEPSGTDGTEAVLR